MKKIVLIAMLGALAVAQDLTLPVSRLTSGSITAASTACTARSCVAILGPSDASAGTVQLSGTFVGTLQFETSVDGTLWSGVGSSTTTGSYPLSLSGTRLLRVRASAYTSGTVAVSIGVGPGTGLGTPNTAGGPVVLDANGNAAMTTTVLGPYVIVPASGKTTLPTAASGNSGYTTIVTDGTTGGDCTTGGGTSAALCRSNGSAWVALGGSSGSAPVTATVTSQSSIAITHNLGTSAPWVSCFDGSGNMLGSTGASTSLVSVVATSTNVVTLTFSNTTTGTCLISTGSMGPIGATGPPATFLGAWNTNVTYTAGQSVSYLGSSYVSLTAGNSAHVPSTLGDSNWGLLAAKGATGTPGTAATYGASAHSTGTFAQAGWRTIAWDANDWDTCPSCTMHSATVDNTRFTAPVTGHYLAEMAVEWNSASAGALCQGQILVNGSGVRLGPADANLGYGISTVQAVLALTAGQYVEFQAYHAGGGTIGFASGSNAATLTYLGF